MTERLSGLVGWNAGTHANLRGSRVWGGWLVDNDLIKTLSGGSVDAQTGVSAAAQSASDPTDILVHRPNLKELICVFLAELEELLLSLKQVRGCLSDQQSQNDVELVLALLNKVI